MKEEMRTIGYLCPACHKRVIQQRSVFALSASGAVVSCECGESSLTIEAEENKFRLSVPCGVCGEEHLAECSADKLLHGAASALPAPIRKCSAALSARTTPSSTEMEQLSLAAAKEREQGDDPLPPLPTASSCMRCSLSSRRSPRARTVSPAPAAAKATAWRSTAPTSTLCAKAAARSCASLRQRMRTLTASAAA